jgi:drug/metabolite transporter (DMT)-like permease
MATERNNAGTVASRRLSEAMLAGSAVAYSTAGYFTRLIPLDVWTLLFWRGIAAGLVVAAFAAWQLRGVFWHSVRRIGWIGLVAAGLLASSSLMYIASLRRTGVADVSVIYATIPLLTAALDWLLLRQVVTWRVMIASVAALGGIVIMVGGTSDAGRLVGDALAFGMTLGFALTVVLLRYKRDVPMLPAIAVSCLLAALISAPFRGAAPGVGQIGQMAVFGVLQLGLGLILLTYGLRRVGATEAALIGVLDAPLAPLWVWLAFAEIPSWATVIGGGVVMAAVVWYLAGPSRETQADDGPPATPPPAAAKSPCPAR